MESLAINIHSLATNLIVNGQPFQGNVLASRSTERGSNRQLKLKIIFNPLLFQLFVPIAPEYLDYAGCDSDLPNVFRKD